MKIRIDKQNITPGDSVHVPAGAKVEIEIASPLYGHGFNHDQPYPLNKGCIDAPHFAVNNIQSPVWVVPPGLVIQADTRHPLCVVYNKDFDNTLRLSSDESFELKFHRGATPEATWKLYTEAIGYARPTLEPSQLGDVWFCTWTQFPRCITQARILQMARDIRDQKYPCSTLIIDDRWESCFGELEFSADFPDPAAMVAELHRLGFRVLLWVTPFVNEEAKNFGELEKSGVLVADKNGGAARLRWWGGTAGLVDVTGDAGREHLRSRLVYLKDTIGVDGFKIDGGDAKYQPPADRCSWCNAPGASGYSDCLLALFEEIAPGCCETRTAWQSQNRNIIWREGGKDSHWGANNGLRAMLSLGLHLSLMGYDTLIPDMVPGRVQTMESNMALPTDELMVRWTELSVFFPIVQFSYYPWNYKSDAAKAVLGLARAHKALEKTLTDAMRDLSRPLMRPLWFDHPEIPEYHDISDEFMLGCDLVLAPVLEAGRVRRRVILPPGDWLDAWTGDALRGGNYPDYPSPCPGIPVFVRASNPELFEALHAELCRIDRQSVESGRISTTYNCGLDRDLTVTG